MTDATPIFCRDCGYDLRTSDERCPECGLDLESSRSFPGICRAGAGWAARLGKRLTLAVVLAGVAILLIVGAVSLPAIVPVASWMPVANLLPFLALAAIPLVLRIKPPAHLNADWAWTRRLSVGGTALALGAAIFENLLIQLPRFNSASFWKLVAVTSALQCLLFVVLPLSLTPFARMLPARHLVRLLVLIALAAVGAIVFSSVTYGLMLGRDVARFQRLQAPLQLAMAACLLVSMGGWLVALVVIRFRVAAQARRLGVGPETETARRV